MKYIKPKCNCGGKLNLIQIITCRQITSIKRNGRLSNICRIQAGSYAEFSGAEWLECEDCGEQYMCSFEKGGDRIIREEKREI